MDIFINGQPLDFELEQEKTADDILNQLTTWTDENNRLIISTLINDRLAGGNAAEVPLEEIQTLSLNTVPDVFKSLTFLGSSLRKTGRITEDDREYGNDLSLFCTSVVPDLKEIWETSLTAAALEGKQTDTDGILKELTWFHHILRSRIAELRDPVRELYLLSESSDTLMSRLYKIIEQSRQGLEGETSHSFIEIIEIYQKIIRLLDMINGYDTSFLKKLTVDGLSFEAFQTELNGNFQEIISAFENRDSILFTDILEYEIAEKIPVLLKTLCSSLRQEQP